MPMNTDSTLKRCSECRREYPATVEYFIRHSGTKSGFTTRCKACTSEAARLQHQQHLAEQRREYEAAHPLPPDVRCLAYAIRQLKYGDALTSGAWRLERQCMQQIRKTRDSRGEYVIGSSGEYLLYRAGELCGVYDKRGEVCYEFVWRLSLCITHDLLSRGWQWEQTRLIEDGAQTNPETPVSRVKRLLKEPRGRREAAQIGHDHA
jgi:hypothetical protein